MKSTFVALTKKSPLILDHKAAVESKSVLYISQKISLRVSFPARNPLNLVY